MFFGLGDTVDIQKNIQEQHTEHLGVSNLKST